jgi:hypothetical protein
MANRNGARAAAGGGSWEPVGPNNGIYEVVGAAVNTMPFTGLVGAIDREYFFKYSIIKTDATARDIDVRLNGLTTNMASSIQTGGNRDPRSKLTIADAAREVFSGWFYMWASRYVLGSVVARGRTFTASCFAGDQPAVETGAFDQHAAGIWTGTEDIVSLQVVCTTQDTTTLQAELDAGSIGQLWRRVPGT